MLRAWFDLVRFVENYRYYRRMGLRAQEARDLAHMTLPER